MIKRKIALAILLSVSSTGFAQQQEGKKNIEKLCGCFNVDFKYAETFSPDATYKFHERDYSEGTELVLPIESTDKKIVLQHLLIVGDNYIVKHWRENWEYEAPLLYTYQGDKVWTKTKLPDASIKGTWTQTVWEVDDAPRYQGQSKWVSTNGKTYWENTADAPLPRREYTKRDDYNIMNRGNRIMVTDAGWIHEQDNKKISRANGSDKLIAEEKGINSYHKVEESKCAAAKEWWAKNNAFWAVVRDEWKQYMNEDTIKMKAKIEDKVLHEYLAVIFEDWSNNKLKDKELHGRVKEVLAKFLVNS